jgi:hypothetical protein
MTPQGHERYYKIMVSLNLFGEFLLIREYGNTSYAKPTRVLEKSFKVFENAICAAEEIKKTRLQHQYKIVYQR